jgi:hypothetical protein
VDATALFDAALRRHVYTCCLDRGVPPTCQELSDATGASRTDVSEGLTRLAAGRVLVLQPLSQEILMAPPFSAVPTPFVVKTSRHSSYANCAWDALGVSVMMQSEARIDSGCACCGEQLSLTTAMSAPPAGHASLHFAVPAIRWWDDIVFT